MKAPSIFTAIISILFLLFFPFGTVPAAETVSPYVGQESRAIKALSPKEVNGYLQGKGMGFAKPAELNGYPGPRHVLDMAEQLELSKRQLEETGVIFRSMKSRAIELGGKIVTKEEALENLFAAKTVTAAKLATLTGEISTLKGKLRNVHLAAHLELLPILSPEQISRYDKLRGYHQPGNSAGHSSEEGHHGHD